jgi:hypothetical protein
LDPPQQAPISISGLLKAKTKIEERPKGFPGAIQQLKKCTLSSTYVSSPRFLHSFNFAKGWAARPRDWIGGSLVVRQEENENETPESIDPSGFRRLVFWLSYVFGTLILAFSWLLAQVPQPLHGADLSGDYAVRSCAAGLMLISILMARWVWKIRNPLSDRGRATAMRVVLFIAWIELAIACIGIIGIAAFQLSRR